MASNQYGYYGTGDVRPGGYGVIPDIWATYSLGIGGHPGQNRDAVAGWQHQLHHPPHQQQLVNAERGGPTPSRVNYYGGGGANNRRPTNGPRAWTRGGRGWTHANRSRRSPMRFGQPSDMEMNRRGPTRNNITLVDDVEEQQQHHHHHHHREAGQDRHGQMHQLPEQQRHHANARSPFEIYQMQQELRDRRIQPTAGNAAPSLLPTPPPEQHQQHALDIANRPQLRQRRQTQWPGRGQPFNRQHGGRRRVRVTTNPAARPWANEHGDVDLRQRLPTVGLQLDGYGSSDDDDNYVYLDYDSDDEMFEELDDLEVLSMLLEHDCPPEHLAARLAEEAQRRRQLRSDVRNTTQPLPPAVAAEPDKMVEKLPANWEPADDKSHRERLTDELLKGTCECVICFEQIKPAEGIWNCFKCFHIFHVTCIRKWALAQINPINVLLLDRTWRCPSCRDGKRRIPNNNYCFCGKTRNPDVRACGMPHSCGYECGRRRRQKQPSCAHPCPMTCHPGPCPPCLLNITRHCPCTKTSRVIKCCDGDLPSCKQSCDKLLSCGQHRCKELCHPNPCPPCDQLLLQECYCGRGSRVLGCSEATSEHIVSPYRCVAVCNRLLPCKMCRCLRVCHDGRCARECRRHLPGSLALEVATVSLQYTEPGQYCTIL